MKAPAKPEKRSLAFNMTPLIDVTFLLIVFFVMSSRLIREEVAMEIDLPRETSGKSIEDDESGKIVLNVLDENVFYFGAQRVTLDELRERLVREKKRATRETSVRIRANRTVPYAAVEPLLVLCAQSGFPDVSFSVVEE